MNKDTHKILILIYLVIILMAGFWVSKDILFFKPVPKSTIELLNTKSLNTSQNELSKRNYSVDINKIEFDNFIYGSADPFQ